MKRIETLISETLIGSKISRKKYAAVINGEEKYRKLKEDIIMIKSNKIDVGKDKLNEDKWIKENNENA